MRYLGGKADIGKSIAGILEARRAPGALFVDMCCGSLNVTRHMPGKRIAVDACESLITMWRAAVSGWVPPIQVTREQYASVKASPNPQDPMTAFVMFGCSFGGKWGGGYAADRPQQRYAEGASNQIVKKARDCANVGFVHASFEEVVPGRLPPGTVLYCDPPYAGTTGYGAVPKFDHTSFWSWANGHRRADVKVFVSEYVAPEDWRPIEVHRAVQGGRLTPGKKPRTDFLFT